MLQDHTDLHPFLSEISCKAHYPGASRSNCPVIVQLDPAFTLLSEPLTKFRFGGGGLVVGFFLYKSLKRTLWTVNTNKLGEKNHIMFDP